MFPVLLFTKDDITDLDLLARVRDRIAATHPLNVFMQERFREISRTDVRAAGFPVASDRGVEDLFEIAGMSLDRAEVLERVETGVRRMSWLARELCERLYEPTGTPIPVPPCPVASDGDEALMTWVPYAQRTSPPAEARPQPQDAWMIR